MKAIRTMILIVCMLCLYNTNSFSQTQIGHGSEFWGAQGLVQKWFLIDNNNRIITIQGNIAEIRYNVGIFYDDLDWNVFITPTPQFNWCMINTIGQMNSQGSIELEVKSRLTDIRQFFDEGDLVLAKGTWVEDTGHSALDFDKPAHWEYVIDGLDSRWVEFRGKTEIHPINFLRTGSSVFAPNTICFYPNEDTKIFMAQDASNRFYNAADFPIQESFHFRANETNTPFFTLNLLNDQDGSADVEVYRETAYLRGGAIASLGHNDNELTYDVSIPPYLSGEGGAFMGIFSSQRNPLLKYKTRSYLEPGNEPNTDELRFEIEVELLNPSDVDFTERWWCWQENWLEGALVWLSPLENHQKISYELIYAPSRGYNNTSWELYVLGNSRRWDWHPPSSSSASERVAAISQGYFGFQKSGVSYTKEAKVQMYECPGRATDEEIRIHNLINGYKIRLQKNLMNSANLTDSKWYIKIFEDGSGNTISTPIETLINQGTQDIQGLNVQLYPNPPYEMVNVTFGLHSESPQFELWTRINNFGKFQIIYRGKTNFGENLEFSTQIFSGTHGMCAEELNFGPDWMEDIIKGLMAIDKLNALGLLDPRVLPEKLPDKLLEDWENVRYVSLGLIHEFCDKCEGENKRLVDAYLRYTMGEVLKYEDWKLMGKMIKMATELPDLKIYPAKIQKLAPKFDKFSVPDLMAPNNIFKIPRSDIKRSESFWRKLIKRRLPRF